MTEKFPSEDNCHDLHDLFCESNGQVTEGIAHLEMRTLTSPATHHRLGRGKEGQPWILLTP